MITKNVTTQSLLQSLKTDYLNLIWIAEHAKVDFEHLLAEANKANINIAGGIFPGVLYGKERFEDAAIIHYLPLESEMALIPHKGSKQLPELPIGCNSIYLMVDGLAEGIPEVLLSMYQKYWDTVPIIGGGCGSLSLKQMPCIFTNEGIFQDHALMITSQDRIQIGIQHGWKKIAGPFIISKAKDNVIYEINWEPAFDFYKKIVDGFSPQPVNKEAFFDVSKAYPFGIGREGHEDVVRDPIVTEDGKSITCVGEMPENATIKILMGVEDELIKSAEQAANIALENISPSSIFVVDCISRVLFLEDSYEKELGAIQDQLEGKLDTPLEGVLTLGEISTFGEGFIEFFNKTIVVSAKY